MAKIIEVSTSRLMLRQWKVADLEPFAALNADAQVMEFFPSTLRRFESDALAERCQALIAERGWGFWAVELKATQKFIGLVGLNNVSSALPFAPCVEIGWRLASTYWGQGLATEAAQAALRVGFETLCLTEIVSFTTLQNQRSQAVMQRLGMQASGTFLHPLLPENSPLRLHALYRLPSAPFNVSLSI
jgi:RimJ/RimL family protein N-acetyltransferase